MKTQIIKIGLLICTTLVINVTSAQEGPRRGGQGQQGNPPGRQDNQTDPIQLEQQLQSIISEQNIQPVNTEGLNVLASDNAKVQLGKQLFFSKNLGGEQSAACVSCHHPKLGGGDNLSLSIGVDAVDERDNSAHDLLGLGRFNANDEHPVVPRNAPTIFNLALYQQGLFWDSRVERRRNGGIATPDSPIDTRGRRQSDPNLPQNATLANAQARFPVTSAEEMRDDFLPGQGNTQLRTALVSRLNDDIVGIASNWPAAFAQVYGTDDITVDTLFDAISEYERSMVFVNSPWQNYLLGDNSALTDNQKQGAILFFTPTQNRGAGCAMCHNGPSFTNERHHLVAFPQIGVGKGNTSSTGTSQDFGRENITGSQNDRFHFRTPTLLNIAATAPYGHTGAYQTLEEVVRHYNNPEQTINELFAAQNGQPFSENNAPYCQLPQVQLLMQKHNKPCEEVFPDSYINSIEIAQYLQQAQANNVTSRAPLRARPNLSPLQVNQLTDFLMALTDPCVEDEACLSPWLLNADDLATFPDNMPLNAINQVGDTL